RIRRYGAPTREQVYEGGRGIEGIKIHDVVQFRSRGAISNSNHAGVRAHQVAHHRQRRGKDDGRNDSKGTSRSKTPAKGSGLPFKCDDFVTVGGASLYFSLPGKLYSRGSFKRK